MTTQYEAMEPAPKPISQAVAQYLQGSISVGEILQRAMRGWLFVVIGGILGFLVGLDTVWNSTPAFIATVNLVPSDSGGTGGVGGGTDVSGGGALDLLADITGLSSGNIPKFARFANALSSPGVAKIMDDRYHLLCRTYSGQCDIKTGKWRERTGQDAWVAATIARLGHLPDPNGPRTLNDLAEFIGGSITLTADKKTRMIVASNTDRNPHNASWFLTAAIQAANDYVKNQDRAISQQYVQYLSRQLQSPNITLSEHQALSDLLVQQERSLMLTGVNLPYAANIVDPPVVVPKDIILKTLAAATFIGFVLGAVAAAILALMPERIRLRSRIWKRF